MLLFIELVFKSLKRGDYHEVTKKCEECRLTVGCYGLRFQVFLMQMPDRCQISPILFILLTFDHFLLI